jgi:hypothetical protein
MVLLVGLLCSAWVMVFALHAGAEPPLENEAGALPLEQKVDQEQVRASTPGAGAATELERWEETLREKDKEHMLQIWRAIMDYKKAKGQLPDYLSDLVPDFLPEKEVLISPVENAYFRGASDPKLKTTYSYEFSVEAYGQGGLPFRSVKEAQMKEFGPVVPILRCFAHGKVVLNVSFAGDYYESQLFWERSAGAKELMQKHGTGPGFEEGDFTDLRVVDGQTGTGLAGAEVQLTRRYYHDLALPDRTLTTDAVGHVRVPLGPPPERRLTVTVVKQGYTALPQTWLENALPVEKTWPMKAAAAVGGVVKDRAGAPLGEATVTVYAAMVETGAAPISPDDVDALLAQGVPVGVPGDEGPHMPMRLVERCKTDATGHWRCDRLPLNFGRLRFVVDHESAWRTEFRSGGEEQGPKIDRDALLAMEAEFKLEPAAVVSGVLLAPDGKPLPGEEVSVAPVRRAARIAITGTRGSAQSIPKNAMPRLKTDGAGRFSLKWQAPGELTLSAVPAGFGMVARVVQPSPGMGPVELKASSRRKIAGRVHDANGRPVSGVVVTFIGWADVPAETRVAVTDEKGEFVWDAAPGGQVGFTFQGGGLTPSTEWVSAGKAETMDVELRGLGRGEE